MSFRSNFYYFEQIFKFQETFLHGDNKYTVLHDRKKRGKENLKVKLFVFPVCLLPVTCFIAVLAFMNIHIIAT